MSGWDSQTTDVLMANGLLEIGDGYRAKNSEFRPLGGLPFVRVGDIGNRIALENLDELPQSMSERLGPKVSQPHDSLITMKGTVGRVAYVRPDLSRFVYSPQISYWRSKDHRVIDPRWLRYWLESPEFVYQALATKGSTDMADYINLRDQRRMRITIPPRPVQQRIADVLGSIDDLIENNRRRIEVLEEMAQAIYREWFVHFRFPGHEDATFVDSPLGPIPDGWEISTIGDVLTLKYGKALKKDNRIPGSVAVVGSSGVVDSHVESLVSGPSIVIGRKGNVGSVTWLRHDCWPIDTTYFVETDLPLHFVRRQLMLSEFKNTHAAVPGLSREMAYGLPFVLPRSDLVDDFHSIAEKVDAQKACLKGAGDRLASIRDHLLPKLVTGEIDVSELDLDALVGAAG